ncbi:MAG: CRISPR-associated helicase Cas3' [Muribaculaceae bacterium]
MIIAHVNPLTGETQSLEAHSIGVARYASGFTESFGLSHTAFIMGLLHDKGKERATFQSYIRAQAGIEDDEYPPYNYEDKQHAYIGAALLQGDSRHTALRMLAGYQIMGHHTGMPDYTDFEKKIKCEIPPEISPLPEIKHLDSTNFFVKKYNGDQTAFLKDYHHLARVLYSCLVDADFLDTESFMSPQKFQLRRKTYNLETLLPLLDKHFVKMQQSCAKTPLNIIRNNILQKCNEAAGMPTGFFMLDVPTGTGKTLSSISWAIRHAIARGKKRIIYAIPYTSVVTQTANVLSEIFGRENVLEHHSAINSEELTENSGVKLATENWDYPIIVTTNVQLFQSIFSNKPSKCRKLHNLVESVLVLDEVHTLPHQHMQPILDALKAYNKLFELSVLFCTASMPAIDKSSEWTDGQSNELDGIENITSIVPEEWELHKTTRRCDIELLPSPMSCDKLAQKLCTHERVLCVVNTRKDAKAVFDSLPDDSTSIHLSRMMCPAHIKQKINEIKHRLHNAGSGPLRVVATQLIEAGVDIDFPAVYRQESGLDSILQAAGRCNREGKLSQATAYVFRLAKKPFGDIGRACDALNATFGYFSDGIPDWHSPSKMHEYFVQRYARCATFDKANIKTLLYRGRDLMFATAASEFKLIEDAGASVIVNFGDSQSLMEQWKKGEVTYSLRKQLLQYSVNVNMRSFNALMVHGAVEEFNGLYFINSDKYYSHKSGLILDNVWLEETLII